MVEEIILLQVNSNPPFIAAPTSTALPFKERDRKRKNDK